MGMCRTPSCVTRFTKDAWHELKGTPFREDSYTEADWVHHLTWKRYIPEPRILSIIVLSLAPVWLWSMAVAVALGLYATFAEPHGAPKLSNHAGLILPFQLTSFALSLLMLFRTNSSYGRWWEARTLWGSAYITCRSIMRLCICYVGRDSPHLLPALHRWNAAFTPALATLLRQKEHYLDDHLSAVLAEAELEWLRKRGSPPIAALQVLSSLLNQATGLSDIERQQIEALINHCDTITGGCERIFRQPIPHAWNRHTLRFLLVYVTFLPFAFW
jgi:predicted membrane chloride channel (bestrophin family)